MRKLSLNFLKTLAIILSSSLLFDFNLAFGIKSLTINGEKWWKHNGVEEGGKVRLSCQVDNWYIRASMILEIIYWFYPFNFT